MKRRRLTALLCLALLQVYTVAAGLVIVTMAPRDEPVLPWTPSWPTVTAAPPPLAPVASRGSVAGSEVAQVLAPRLSASALGGSIAATVVNPATHKTLFSQRADVPATPASTAKIATAVTALSSLGPNFRLSTRVVRDSSAGQDGSIILVGGGDSTLASPEAASDPGYPNMAELADLAKETVRTLADEGITAVHLGYDASLFVGPDTGPGWKSNYVPEGSVSPVSALSVDGGRVDPDSRARVSDPARAAAESFAELLERGGITVVGSIEAQRAPKDAAQVAQVRSPRLRALVEHMLGESNNDLAEALARHVAIKEGLPASFAGAAKAVHQVLTRLGVAAGVHLVDGSGLSTRDRVTAAALARLLSLAASPDHPALRSILTGLPIAGFSGTLRYRYDGDAAQAGVGTVRAKTGTLNGVSSLAGVVHTSGGGLLVFAFVANDVPVGGTYAAEAALDRLAAALATCGCG